MSARSRRDFAKTLAGAAVAAPFFSCSSKSRDPVGKKVVVKARDGEGPISRFLGIVKVGESIKLDVANKDGDSFRLLELTESQRERLKK